MATTLRNPARAMAKKVVKLENGTTHTEWVPFIQYRLNPAVYFHENPSDNRIIEGKWVNLSIPPNQFGPVHIGRRKR